MRIARARKHCLAVEAVVPASLYTFLYRLRADMHDTQQLWLELVNVDFLEFIELMVRQIIGIICVYLNRSYRILRADG